jgi:hypothetical protein
MRLLFGRPDGFFIKLLMMFWRKIFIISLMLYGTLQKALIPASNLEMLGH